jgi:hypothetical protein
MVVDRLQASWEALDATTAQVTVGALLDEMDTAVLQLKK